MGTMPNVIFKVEKWNLAAGSTGNIDIVWFRIKGIPYEKRSEQNICKVGSYVGLPMEVDMENINRFDYVREKIGCRDVTKVSAEVNGMIDFLFYDFKFQREVVHEGVTNPAGNKWVRNDRAGVDHPSPKKQKTMGHNSMTAGTSSVQQSTGKNTGNFTSVGVSQGKQKAVVETENLAVPPSVDTSNADQRNVEGEIEESDEESSGFGEFLSPGGQSFNFGSFEQHEIRKIWAVRLAENKTTAINEYGSNLRKSSFDPLAAIEAKAALMRGKQAVTA